MGHAMDIMMFHGYCPARRSAIPTLTW